MRGILLAMLVSLGIGLAACAEPTIKSDQFSCQSPQVGGLSKQFASRLCVQNDILAKLDVEGPALEKATHAVLDRPPNDRTANNGISCLSLSGHSFSYCAYGSYWLEATPLRRAFLPSESYVAPFPFVTTTQPYGFTVAAGPGR